MPACLPCVCLQSCDEQNDSESSDCARGLNSTGSRGILGAYGLKSTGRCESSARVRFEKLLPERCWNSYCSVVSLLCSDTLSNFFRKSTAERERCRSSSDIFSSRVASSWTLVFNADHQLSSTITGSFVKRQWKRPGRTVSSDRVVSFYLVSIADRGHAVRTVRRVTSHCLSSKSECVDPRRKIVSRR